MSELINLGDTFLQMQNRVLRDEGAASIEDLDLHPAGEPLDEHRDDFNTANLTATSPALNPEKPYTIVHGNATTIRSKHTSVLDEDATFHGVSFFADESAPGNATVRVASDKRAIFIACSFERPGGASDAETVTVEDDAQAIFIGCLFVRGSLGVKNEGGAADTGNVILIGCSKRDLSSFGDHVTTVNCLG
jgi:hypothetical protein